MAAPVFSAINDLDTLTDNLLAEYGVTTQTTAEVIRWLNQAIYELQHRYEILKDTFPFNIAASTSEYQYDTAAPYPYRLDKVWYGLTTLKHELFPVSLGEARALIATANVDILKYALEGDTWKHSIVLGGVPAGVITAGLNLYGPYDPVFIAAGGTMPTEQKFDAAIIALGVAYGAEQYIPAEKTDHTIRELAEAEIRKLFPQEQVVNG